MSKFGGELKSLTTSQIEEELRRVTYNSKYLKILKSTIYSLVMVFAFAVLVVTLVMPVLEVSETSMDPLIKSGEVVLAFKTKSLESGDVIAFYQGNKILIKRVIAIPGDWLNIDLEGNVYVNGELLDEVYVTNKVPIETSIEFPYQIPESQYFVLSDNREVATDSRDDDIGCIRKENVIGKVIYRVWPLKRFGVI